MNFNSKTTHILFIALILVVVFAGSLKNNFAWDDKYLVINNANIRNFNHTPEILSKHLYEGSGMDSNFYRPLQLFSFAVDYSIWKLNPFGYHLTSLLLHVFNSALIYLIVFALCSSGSISFLSALMFGVSPVISGTVYYISARADLLMALFLLSSIYLFIRYRETNRNFLYLISVVSFILSLLCKEMAIILPFLLVITELFISKEKRRISLKPLFLYFCILFLYILFRLNFTTEANGFSGHGFMRTIPLWKRILTDFNVIVEYISLLLFPFGLRMQRFIKSADGLFEINVLLSIDLLVLLAFIIKKLSRKDSVFPYAAAWFFICLLPVLNIYPISVSLHEMWLYLPSIGFYIFFSALILKIIAARIGKAITILSIILYMTYYCLTAVSYGKIWHDSISLFKNDLKYERDNPFKHLLYNNMAIAYYDKGDFKKSIEYCKKSISSNPKFVKPYNNLGAAYIAVNRPIRAILFFKKGIQLKRDHESAYCNLGHAYSILGLQDRAVYFSKVALKINPMSYKAYCNLGFVYSKKGDLDQAIRFFKKASSVDKEGHEAHRRLTSLYIKKRDYEEALNECKKALQFGLNDPYFYNVMSFVYIKNKKFKEAEWILKRSILLNSNQFQPHNNLGNIYSMFGQIDLAGQEYREALKIDPGNKGAMKNLNELKREK